MGVSSVTFYKQFADRRARMRAAHEELLGRLLEQVDRVRAAESDPQAKARATLHAALAIFAADQPSAQLLTVEILVAGPEGAKRSWAEKTASAISAALLLAAESPESGLLLTGGALAAGPWAAYAHDQLLMRFAPVLSRAVSSPGSPSRRRSRRLCSPAAPRRVGTIAPRAP